LHQCGEVTCFPVSLFILPLLQQSGDRYSKASSLFLLHLFALHKSEAGSGLLFPIVDSSALYGNLYAIGFLPFCYKIPTFFSVSPTFFSVSYLSI